MTEISSRLPQTFQPFLQNLSKNQLTKLFIESGQKIQKMANISGMNYSDFFDLLVIFHMIDAGTYTSEGGTIGSLNYLFSFNKDKKTMTYSSSILPLVDQLRTYVEN